MAEISDLHSGLTRLRLPTIRRVCTAMQARAEAESWTYREFLEHLVTEELAHRADTRMQRAAKKARFPFVKTIEEFDFTFQSSVKRQALGRFLGPELVSEGRTAILYGKPGRGKTHLATAFAYKAIQNGFSARFTTLAQMLNNLNRAAESGALEVVMEQFVEPDVLVIDEVGYLSYAANAANLLFQVVDQRYLAQRAMLLTTNKATETWGEVLHDADLAEAIVDRLMERGEIIKLSGQSFRNPAQRVG